MTITTRTGLAAALLGGLSQAAWAQDTACPIKVGVLHSLSGTMAISEATLKDTS
jgi:urea transport system substrate-binding protein